MSDMTKENLINFLTTAIDIVNGKPVCETCKHRKMDYQKKEVICDIHNMTIEKMGSYCNLYKKV